MEQISISTATELSNISIWLWLTGVAVLIIGIIIGEVTQSPKVVFNAAFISTIISLSVALTSLDKTKSEEKIEKSTEEKIQSQIQEQDIFKSNIYESEQK